MQSPLVLLVDDCPLELEVLEVTLRGLSADIQRATSGDDALQLAAQREPAVVLLDVAMPGLDGFETARQMRAQPGRENTPIIFITGHSGDTEKLIAGYAAGGVDYLVKPINPTFVRAKVSFFIEQHRKTEQIRRLGRSNAELERFVNMVSHDLRAPLRTIVSFAQLLESEFGAKVDDGDFQEMIGFITGAALRMREMMEGLFEYSRLGGDAAYEVVDLEQVLTWATDNLHSSLEASGAKVERGPLPSVLGNPVQLLQVFQNLIDNAIKFRGEAPPLVRIEASREGDVWHLAVRDNGVGIDPSQHARVFRIFQQLGTSGEGSGVGLALVERIVTSHGGRVWVDSSPGRGATFHVTLRAVEDGVSTVA